MSTAITLAPRPAAPPPARGRAAPSSRRLTVRANFFPLEWQTPKTIYHYDVSIDPEPKGDTIRRNREIIDRLQRQIEPQLFRARASYDGRKNMYSSEPYAFPGSASVASFPVNMTSQPGPVQAGTPGHFMVTLKRVGVYDPKTLMRYVAGRQAPSSADVGEIMQLLNCLGVILRQAALTNASGVTARSIFTDDQSKAIMMGFTLVKGYFQSVRPAQNRVLLNLDVTTALQWTPAPLMTTLLEYVPRGQYAANDPQRLNNLPEGVIVALNRALRGLKIKVTHRPNTPPKSILRFDGRGANQIRLKGDPRTVREFFQQAYNITLHYPNAPCVWLSDSAALPVELCVIEKQMYRRIPPPQIMREVLEFSKRRPEERLAVIRAGLNVMQYATSEYVARAGLRVGTEPVSVQARCLNSLSVNYKNGVVAVRDGAWNLKDRTFLSGATLRVWGLVDLRSRRSQGTMEELRAQLTSMMMSLGMNVVDQNPPIRVVQNIGQMESELDRFCQQLLERVNKGQPPQQQQKNPDLLVCVIDGSGDLYTRVKHWGDVSRGVSTQCLRAEKVMRLNPQYLGNVAMKINLKRGSSNHFPKSPWMDWLAAGPTIVFGADTSHPGPGETGKPTISAVASSIDLFGTVYITDVRVQQGRQEIIADLPNMIMGGIIKFLREQTLKGRPNHFPRRLLFYRDGVSEGQFEEVCGREVRAIDVAWDNLMNHPNLRAVQNKPPRPAVTFIIVGKRHHVRFFPERKDADRSGNAPAGLVVDTDIVHPSDWDFYLQAHGGILGTSRPMHATVLVDQNNLTEDGVEELTFALTHNYPRATRSVSIPSPVYHAHLAGGRAKIHYDSGFNSDGGTVAGSGALTLNDFKQAFKPIHPNLSNFMYWM